MGRLFYLVCLFLRTVVRSVEALMYLLERLNDMVRENGKAVGDSIVNIDVMNLEVQAMSSEMLRVSRPARAINKMMPFP